MDISQNSEKNQEEVGDSGESTARGQMKINWAEKHPYVRRVETAPIGGITLTSSLFFIAYHLCGWLSGVRGWQSSLGR